MKKAEHQRIDAYELQCWRRLSRVLQTEKRSNQLILKEINPEYSLEGLMLKLQFLILGKIEGRKRSGDRGLGGWMASSTQWT